MFFAPPSVTIKLLVVVVLRATLIVAPPFAYPREIGQNLSQLVVEARGELVLDGRGDVHYKKWSLQPLHASAHIGMLMVLPARIFTRKEIAPPPTSFLYGWGAALMVEGELSAEKK